MRSCRGCAHSSRIPRYRVRAAVIAAAIATEDGVADAVDYLATGIAARQ